MSATALLQSHQRGLEESAARLPLTPVGISSNPTFAVSDEAACEEGCYGSFASVSSASVSSADEGAAAARTGAVAEGGELPRRPPPTLAEHRRRSYERQHWRWLHVEQQYLKHPHWCEPRIILLLQEAFRPSYQALRREHAQGRLSAEQFAARRADLKSALDCIKSEYRRTLLRLRDSSAPHEELASLASKAVTCIASVYPWSSSGFSIPYEENLVFGEVASPTTVAAARSAAAVPMGCPRSASSTPPFPKQFSPPAEQRQQQQPRQPQQRPTCAVCLRLEAPRQPLQQLPPRKEGFQRSVAADGSVVLSAAPVAQPSKGLGGLKTFSPPPAAATYSGPDTAHFASPLGTPGSPPQLLPLFVTGPVRPEELRYLERKQLVQTPHSFFARSLAAVPFIGMRRSVIAQQRTKSRLPLPTPSPTLPTPDPTITEAAVKALRLSPCSPVQDSREIPLTPELASLPSECSTRENSRCKRDGKRGSLGDVQVCLALPPSRAAAEHHDPTATTPVQNIVSNSYSNKPAAFRTPTTSLLPTALPAPYRQPALPVPTPQQKRVASTLW